ncbi:DoxX family protein [Deinococcus arenae]|uniref:DoxX family protein n=1 Tax=Deinococcus arenae TaxID=1452751 RepID=UPI00227D8368|nr:DoxX family protein [Deinococcus arenae]
MTVSPVPPRPSVGTLLLAALFVTAGALHFMAPAPFDRIVPPWVPLTARQATLISGAAELLGGLGLLHPRTRPAARWGLLALLVAVFPANVWMAQEPERFRVSPAVAWGRLPLQPLLMWAVWRAGRARLVAADPLR